MSITEKRLNEIQDRIEGAIRGPWIHDVIEFRSHMSNAVKVPLTDHMGTELVVIAHTGYGLGSPHRNASFMAHARDDVPDLLAEVHRLRDELARTQGRLNSESRAHTEQITELYCELAKAQEVTDEKVEVACKAYYEARADELDDTIRPRWDRLLAVSPDICGVYRTHQRAALTAVLGGDDA